jgi:hypothetical protein
MPSDHPRQPSRGPERSPDGFLTARPVGTLVAVTDLRGKD